MSQMMTDFHDHHIVIGGDFNTRHSDWGHEDETKKGQDIYEEYSSAGLTLLNDQRERTRVGQSERQQDSTPDLTITTNFTVAEWRREEDTWGSDHYPITVGIKENGADKRKRKSKTVIWNTFRLAVCTEYQIQDINELTHALREATQNATVRKLIDVNGPTSDTRLLSLWQKRVNHLNMYRAERKRKDLQAANQLAKEAHIYASKLNQTNWLDLCESFNEHTSLAKMWST
ncbi:hypothetical protein HPB47_007719 [Ixodes persulcatus]|uniref:Uncharacterized protein n=1 Tax=Ixodes persulcatus TaxID=34615 RepID=A0AC60P6V8_IXOPE|nr:hypothetical protein HPB47_007719 [Ixodes persulcatus]